MYKVQITLTDGVGERRRPSMMLRMSSTLSVGVVPLGLKDLISNLSFLFASESVETRTDRSNCRRSS